METFKDIFLYHPVITLAIMVIPWCWAVGVWVGLLILAYRKWLWKGMDKEDRFEYIKVAKW